MFSITTLNSMPGRKPCSSAHDLQNPFVSHLQDQFSVGSQRQLLSSHVFEGSSASPGGSEEQEEDGLSPLPWVSRWYKWRLSLNLGQTWSSTSQNSILPALFTFLLGEGRAKGEEVRVSQKKKVKVVTRGKRLPVYTWNNVQVCLS